LGVRRRLCGVLLLALGGTAWAGVHAVAHRAADLGMPAHAGHGHGTAVQPGYLSTSLSLCLSLALVLAAASSVYPRWRGGSVRSLWLFGAVPVLGLLAGAVVDSGGLHGGLAGNLVELLPVIALVVAVQSAVALTAVGVARGLLDAVEGTVRALLGAASTVCRATPGLGVSFEAERAPVAIVVSAGRPRAPPARTSAS
jgi:hypothetical protein